MWHQKYIQFSHLFKEFLVQYTTRYDVIPHLIHKMPTACMDLKFVKFVLYSGGGGGGTTYSTVIPKGSILIHHSVMLKGDKIQRQSLPFHQQKRIFSTVSSQNLSSVTL
jgi:hypothetical protein